MLHTLSIRELRTQLDSKQLSAVELAQHFLDRAEAPRGSGAFIRRDAEATLTQTRAAVSSHCRRSDKRTHRHSDRAQDVFVTRDFATTASSKMLAQYMGRLTRPSWRD